MGGDISYTCMDIYIYGLRKGLCREFMSRGLPSDKFRLKWMCNSQPTGYGPKFRGGFIQGFGGYDLQ